ncbi:MAG: metalloenzyme [Myxococcales bacterium]|nr:metalloenzyme [Myxococcales bacterium]
MRVALLFIDGVGIGEKDASKNPLARGRTLLSQFQDGSGEPLEGGQVRAVDATFGLGGRPQSATNQAAIFTGEPASLMLGRHLLGFPNAFLRELISRKSIARRLADSGRRCAYLNSFPAACLDALRLPRRPSAGPDLVIPQRARRRLRASAVPLAMSAGGLLMRTLDDARRGEGLTSDIDGRRATSRGLEAPVRSPEEAGEIFWRVAERSDLSVFEHHLADEAGHARSMEAAEAALSTFDRFARRVVALRPAGTAVLVCSDHGNVEDLSTRSHTRNRVPVLAFGTLLEGLETVADVGRLALSLAGAEPRAAARKEAARP